MHGIKLGFIFMGHGIIIRILYPLVTSNMASWRIPELNGGLQQGKSSNYDELWWICPLHSIAMSFPPLKKMSGESFRFMFPSENSGSCCFSVSENQFCIIRTDCNPLATRAELQLCFYIQSNIYQTYSSFQLEMYPCKVTAHRWMCMLPECGSKLKAVGTSKSLQASYQFHRSVHKSSS